MSNYKLQNLILPEKLGVHKITANATIYVSSYV